MGVSLSGNCNFVEMRLLDNLCGGESSVHHARRRWTDGPSCSGNLPNLIVSGDFFSLFLLYSLSDLEFTRSKRAWDETVT